MNHASKTAAVLAAMAAPALWGCGGGPPAVSGSSDEATIKGTVTIAGKTATGGVVIFDPSNIRRPTARGRTAPIGKDGSYSVTTLVGENMVTVDGPRVPRNNATIIVRPGENTVPIEVTKEATPPGGLSDRRSTVAR